MFADKKPPKKVTNVEKNFMYECEICYEDYDNKSHRPMIICSNFHALCLQCVNSNLFKMEYNERKNPTGRFMCSKCSQIIDKTFIREHHILKEVCNYISNIKQRDEEMRKDFYNYVGSMGMNLVAMREDFDSIEKNNILLKKENEELIKENCKVREDYAKIEKAAGSYEELKKIMQQVQETKEALELEKVKLQSITEEYDRRNRETQLKKDECLKENQRYFEIQTQVNYKQEELKKLSKKSIQLIEHNEGAINLKEYLEQEINNLQNQKKKLVEENLMAKKKIDIGIRKMQTYWESILKNPLEQKQIDFNLPLVKEVEMKKIEEKPIKSLIAEKIPQVLPQKKQEKKPNQEPSKPRYQFDEYERSSIKNFFINNNTVTLTNSRLHSFTHISLHDPFSMKLDQSFTIKINRLNSSQIIIGLMTQECKNKKNIYNKEGFYGYDGWCKLWYDGNSSNGEMKINEGDQVKVSYIYETNMIKWETLGQKKYEVHRLDQTMRNKKLYPVVMLIDQEDEFEVINIA